MKDFANKYSNEQIDKFELMEIHLKSGKKLIARTLVSEQDNILALHLPIEYGNDDKGVIYKKLFNTSDSTIFAFPLELIEGMASVNKKWELFYTKIMIPRAYYEKEPDFVDDSEEEELLLEDTIQEDIIH